MLKSKLASDGTLLFMCPGCSTHHGVATVTPFENGAIWQFNGNEESPTLSPSVLCQSKRPKKNADKTPALNDDGSRVWEDRVCHSFVTDGRIQFLSDCTHELAGQTVDLPEWDG